MALLITHILICLLSIGAILFLYKQYKNLRKENSKLQIFWLKRSPKMFTFMKYGLPVVIIGFVLILLANVLEIILLILKGEI